MRGNPIIQSVMILIMLGFIGLAGASFIRSGVHGMDDQLEHQESQPEVKSNSSGIEVEVECHFSDPPLSYSLHRPASEESKERGEIFTAEGSGDSVDYHDIVLSDKKDNVLWLDVTWADEKPSGQYFVQLVLNIDDQEPRKFTFLTHTNTLNGTIQLNLSSLTNDGN